MGRVSHSEVARASTAFWMKNLFVSAHCRDRDKESSAAQRCCGFSCLHTPPASTPPILRVCEFPVDYLQLRSSLWVVLEFLFF